MIFINLYKKTFSNFFKMNFFFHILVFLFLLPKIVFSSSISFEGLSRLNINDLQALTTVDIYQNNLNESQISLIIKELYNSDLIFDILKKVEDSKTILIIEEAKLINEIFINGNIIFKDDVILKNISTKKGSYLNETTLKQDSYLIKNFYDSKGFNNTNISFATESFSKNKINLIIDIFESSPSKLKNINFYGNSYYSNRYLNKLIKSEPIGSFNIFSSGSNLNKSIFDFDIQLIKKAYLKKGFYDSKITYEFKNLGIGNLYNLNFFIEEGERLKVSNIDFFYDTKILSKKFDLIFMNFKSDLNNEDDFFDDDILNKYLAQLNDTLQEHYFINHFFSYDVLVQNSSIQIKIYENKSQAKYINTINITGNSITNDKVIRSKINQEPGDLLNEYKLNSNKDDLKLFRYINDVKIIKNINDNNSVNLEYFINENKKTGNFLIGGSFSGDTGLGLTLNIKDYNILGTGNELDASISSNSEKALFKILYTQYPLFNSNIKNKFSIFNEESDLSNSFGFKSQNIGISYGLDFDYSKNSILYSNFKISNSRGHSATKNKVHINDNIGNFQIIEFSLGYSYDSTNNFLYPTNGFKNNINFKFAPNFISDNPYVKITYQNDNYFENKSSNNFVFLSNRIGIANSLDGNLKTINSFSLGGLNFKGFDYRGIGPFDDNIYLGGNNYFTSSIGYGSSFLLDQKDNINFRIFYTIGSLWDSDYSDDNNLKIRSSIGASFDILTEVVPVTLSYAIPIEKSNSDKIRNFNFSLGTSF